MVASVAWVSTCTAWPLSSTLSTGPWVWLNSIAPGSAGSAATALAVTMSIGDCDLASAACQDSWRS